MVQFNMLHVKDLGLEREVLDSLPYAVVGGAWEGSFQNANVTATLLNHIVPAGQQLKILFLRIWSQAIGGAIFSIVQTNPLTAGLTGAVEAFPVVGHVPPFIAGATVVRDYPMLEAAGAEVLHGGLRDPVHVTEGSVDFRILNTPTPATLARFSVVWWGVEAPFE